MAAMVSGRDFAALLEHHGFDLFTGVPCSMIEDVVAALESRTRGPWVPAVREDAAVGIAGGAWLAGRRPAVLMQNSGLGTSLNALASCSLLYGLPGLLLVTWRGFDGKDAPEHHLTGRVTPALLELLGVSYRVLSAPSVEADVGWAAAEMEARGQPVALVLPPRVIETGAASRDETMPAIPPSPANGSGRMLAPPGLSRFAALGAALEPLGAEPVIHANGYICRESFAHGDRPQNFYMIGSMGLASAIALGVALAEPSRRVVVFDGDGNLLMNLGTLALIAALGPPNLVHCVFDNEAYGSTGNQTTIARRVRLDTLASAAGYRTVTATVDAGEIEAAMRRALREDGPHFILAKVTREEADVPRIPYAPAAIRDRFRSSTLGGCSTESTTNRRT